MTQKEGFCHLRDFFLSFFPLEISKGIINSVGVKVGVKGHPVWKPEVAIWIHNLVFVETLNL